MSSLHNRSRKVTVFAFTSNAQPEIVEFSVASGHRKFENFGPSGKSNKKRNVVFFVCFFGCSFNKSVKAAVPDDGNCPGALVSTKLVERYRFEVGHKNQSINQSINQAILVAARWQHPATGPVRRASPVFVLQPANGGCHVLRS